MNKGKHSTRKNLDIKIKSIDQLVKIISQEKASKKVVVLCHGCYDLLHIGHIKHLEAARNLGDVLVVSITTDMHVNKGPHRPAFPDTLRAEALAALSCVDYVVLNDEPTSVKLIKTLKPSLYVKGIVRGEGKRDHSEAIEQEENAIINAGGKMVFTEEDTYSASALINRFMDIFSDKAKLFLNNFKEKHTPDEIINYIQSIRPLKVLTIGETIIDEYNFCTAMGKANKDPVLAVRSLYKETYAGGILAIANHLSGFCDDVRLLSFLGEENSFEKFVSSKLYGNITSEFLMKPEAPTIVKRRYVEEYLGTKLFEVYEIEDDFYNPQIEQSFLDKLDDLLPECDVVIIADYGHGLFTEKIIEKICDKSKFLAVNSQTNAGNKGYNLISKYPRADFISIAEPEIRLDNRNINVELRELTAKTSSRLKCEKMMVTRGKNGCLLFDSHRGFVEVPAFSVKMVDRIGAGDAVLSIAAPLAAMDVPIEIIGFLGNVIGAEACAIMGNERSVEPSGLFRHLTSLMK